MWMWPCGSDIRRLALNNSTWVSAERDLRSQYIERCGMLIDCLLRICEQAVARIDKQRQSILEDTFTSFILLDSQIRESEELPS